METPAWTKENRKGTIFQDVYLISYSTNSHRHIIDHYEKRIGCDFRVWGGGRINYNLEEKLIEVYGKSESWEAMRNSRINRITKSLLEKFVNSVEIKAPL